MSDDTVPEYPGEGGGRHEFINSDDWRDIQEMTDEELDQFDE